MHEICMIVYERLDSLLFRKILEIILLGHPILPLVSSFVGLVTRKVAFGTTKVTIRQQPSFPS